jgi:exopolysaccharide biosynthesis predicted pyruvyltransferase EpsI
VAILPNNGNLGDALIHAATLQVLERAGVGGRIITGEQGERGDVLLVGGGGNLIDRYEHLLPRLQSLHARFEDVVILPHTIYGDRVGAAFARFGPNVRVVCRERYSYDFLRDVVRHPDRLLLSADLAFHFDYAPYRAAGTGTLNAFRLDQERTEVPIPPDNVDLSDAIQLPGQPYHREFWTVPYWRAYLDAFLTAIAARAHVRTNRLHVAIAAGMLGKRVELFDSDGYKIRAVHEYSLAGRCPTVTYVPAGGRPAMVEAPVSSGSTRPRRVTLHPPEVSGGTATFRFDVDPPSPLYHATRFSLTFPPWIDVRGLPDRLWWTVFLLCLHAQWPYLAPCEVRLPVRLGPGEREFWRRLVSSYLDTLEAYRTGETPGRSIELVDEGPLLPPFAPMADTGWCATSFSGGKDSLLQVGLLTELTRRPLVVTTTSPLPGLFDHETPWRRHVLSEVGRRRRLTFAEVTSDFRATWENHYPRQIGYPVSVNETTDTFLYFAPPRRQHGARRHAPLSRLGSRAAGERPARWSGCPAPALHVLGGHPAGGLGLAGAERHGVWLAHLAASQRRGDPAPVESLSGPREPSVLVLEGPGGPSRVQPVLPVLRIAVGTAAAGATRAHLPTSRPCWKAGGV